MKPFVIEIPKLLGLGRQFGKMNFGPFGWFSANLSAPILVQRVPCPFIRSTITSNVSDLSKVDMVFHAYVFLATQGYQKLAQLHVIRWRKNFHTFLQFGITLQWMFLCAGQVSTRELELRQTSFPGLELCLVIGWSLGSTLEFPLHISVPAGVWP